MLTSALDFMIVMMACALNDSTQKKLDYTQREVRVLKEVVEALTGHVRIPLTDAQRRGLTARRMREHRRHTPAGLGRPRFPWDRRAAVPVWVSDCGCTNGLMEPLLTLNIRFRMQ